MSKQITNQIDQEALSKLTTSAMNVESNSEIDELVDRIITLSESIDNETRRTGNFIPSKYLKDTNWEVAIEKLKELPFEEYKKQMECTFKHSEETDET
jgi:hypothetical protein